MPRNSRQIKKPVHDQTGLEVLCHKSMTDLKQMLSTGEVMHVCRRCGYPETVKRCLGKVREHDMIYAATSLFRVTHQSAATLTLGDVVANVGIPPAPSRIQADFRSRIRAAQQKVEAWPTVGDDRAPCIRAGMVPA